MKVPKIDYQEEIKKCKTIYDVVGKNEFIIGDRAGSIKVRPIDIRR